MNTKRLASLVLGISAVAVASMLPPNLQAQSLAQRIAAVRDGKVRFTFPARADLCGYNNSISRGSSNHMTWSSDISSDVEYDQDCSHGPVRLVLYKDAGRITKIRPYIGGEWRPASAGVTDLGAVSAKDATDYLIALAESDASSVGRDAIMPATFAGGVVVWPPLFRLARNENVPQGTRKQALFWLGAAAGDKITGGRDADEKSDDASEVKKSAVFALSQRRNGEAVPALIEVARNNRDPEVRKSALFWLGQTSDPRAISLFEEILDAR
jgi:HEAT repeat protein